MPPDTGSVTLEALAMASAPALHAMQTRTARDLFAGAAVGALTFAASIVVMLHGGYSVSHVGPGTLDAAGIALVALSTLPLLAWRRAPFGVFVVTAAANVALAAVVYPIGVPLGPAVALYLLAATRGQASPPLRRIATAAGLFLVAYLAAAGLTEATFPGFELLHVTLLWSVAWFAGERARLRRQQIDELKRDAQRERVLAAAEERARIARDLHDSAGHAINVIAVRAGAGRLRHHDNPDRSLEALEAIEDLARRTAEDIDQIVGALRERNHSLGVDAPPGLASLATLIAQHANAGLTVASTVTGTPRQLPSAVDQAAYRILQEALTNASRHTAPGTVSVTVDFRDTALDLRITNPVAAPGPAPNNGTGHGLVGMHERAALLGGNIDVERDNCTFGIRARLPYTSTEP
jgi:signal transduction histidine kinase